MNALLQVRVNGEPRTVDPSTSVTGLLDSFGLATAACAVEINEEIVPHRDHATRALADGDRIEIVTLVGGG